MIVSPEIRLALSDAYVDTFGKPPRPGLQIVRFSNPEVKRYNFHGIAEAEITVFQHSAIFETTIDLQALQTPQEQQRGWKPPISAWISEYHPESLAIYVASGKQPIRQGAERFDAARVCEGLVITLHRHGFEHRRIPFTAEFIPIYLPRTG